MQVVAPVDSRVFVVQPARHSTQAIVETELYLPVSQAVQLVAPSELKVLVVEPAAQLTHEDPPLTKFIEYVVYFPAAHAVHPPEM